MLNQKGFSAVFPIFIIVVIVILAGSFYYLTNQKNNVTFPINNQQLIVQPSPLAQTVGFRKVNIDSFNENGKNLIIKKTEKDMELVLVDSQTKEEKSIDIITLPSVYGWEKDLYTDGKYVVISEEGDLLLFDVTGNVITRSVKKDNALLTNWKISFRGESPKEDIILVHLFKIDNSQSTAELDVRTGKVFVDETANWKTYTSTKGMFSVKYPPELMINEKDMSTPGRYNDLITQITFVFATQSENSYPSILSISVAKNNKDLTLDNLLGNGPGVAYIKDFLKGKEIKKIKIDGVDAVRADDLPVGVVGNTTDMMALKGDIVYQFTFEPREAKDKETAEQILSTFKFAN